MFEVVDGDDTLYDAFKDDYWCMNRKELMQKYDLNEGRYNNLRNRVKRETGTVKHVHSGEYIYPHRNRYRVIKRVDGVLKIFGSYADYNIALKVRDELAANGWSCLI